MSERTTETTVTFKHPFMLGSFDSAQPAGTYRLIIDEEEVIGLSPCIPAAWPGFEAVIRLDSSRLDISIVNQSVGLACAELDGVPIDCIAGKVRVLLDGERITFLWKPEFWRPQRDSNPCLHRERVLS
jgi:hypothetical protein